MSLLYSTIRIISPSSVLRKFTRVMAILFFLFWAATIVLKTYRGIKSAQPTISYGSLYPQCVLPEAVVFLELPSG